MAVTQADVAARAGVARRTVSNVINDFPFVSSDTRSRVKAAIAELGYRPNRAAQNLRTGRSGTIGVILPELDVGYFAEIARLLVEDASARGYTVLIAQTLGDREREIRAIDTFTGQQPDGLIVSPISLTRDDLENHAAGVPVVLIGEHLSESPYPHVAIDNVAATRAAVQHLLNIGRRTIAFVGHMPEGNLDMADLRVRGYTQTLERNGLPLDRALIRPVSGYHRSHGYDATIALLEEGFAIDGLVCANDLLALGAMRALADRGLGVPDDIAVVGFDDLEEGRFSTPRLTTVAPDKRGIARQSLDIIESRSVGASDERRADPAVFVLEVRSSSAAGSPEPSSEG